jgi:hypothetical protein
MQLPAGFGQFLLEHIALAMQTIQLLKTAGEFLLEAIALVMEAPKLRYSARCRCEDPHTSLVMQKGRYGNTKNHKEMAREIRTGG